MFRILAWFYSIWCVFPQDMVHSGRPSSQVGDGFWSKRLPPLRKTDYTARTTDYTVRTTDNMARTTDYTLRTTDNMARTTDYTLRTTDNMARTTDSQMRTDRLLPLQGSDLLRQTNQIMGK